MDKIEAISGAILSFSLRIRNMTLFQIGVTITIILATITGQIQLENIDHQIAILTKFKITNGEKINALSKSWQLDSMVIYYHGESYYKEYISKISTLMLIETLFVGIMKTEMMKDSDIDLGTIEATSDEIHKFFRFSNRIGQVLPLLKTLAEKNFEIEDFTISQLHAYHDYLEFHERLDIKGEFSPLWTKFCKAAVAIKAIVEKNRTPETEKNDPLSEVVFSKEGSEAINWAGNQLARQSDKPGDTISYLEKNGVGDIASASMRLLEMTEGYDFFTTPRAAAVNISYQFIDQQESKSIYINELISDLKEIKQTSIKSEKTQLEKLQKRFDSLKSGQKLNIVGNFEIPREHAWLLLIINFVLLVTILGNRKRIFSLSKQLSYFEEEWQTTMDIIPHVLVFPLKSIWFWCWELHYTVLGLWGLSLSTVLIFSFPHFDTIYGWLWFIGSILFGYALTFIFWVRFRHPFRSHDLGRYHLLKAFGDQ